MADPRAFINFDFDNKSPQRLYFVGHIKVLAAGVAELDAGRLVIGGNLSSRDPHTTADWPSAA